MKLINDLATIDPNDGVTANNILSSFHRGRPLVELREALSCNDQQVVKHAIWITSELGFKALPILDAVSPLLHHPLPYIRYFALEIVLVCSNSEHGAILAKALTLLDDNVPSIRKKAIFFCSKARPEQLTAGLKHLLELKQYDKSSLVQILQWILSQESTSIEKIEAAIKGEDNALRLAGVIAAARLGGKGLPILASVEISDDEAISRFIKHWLRK